MSVLCAALLACAPAVQAADFGRARVLSGVGQPLRVEIPLTRLAPDENAQSILMDVEAGHAADAALSARVPLDTRVAVQPAADDGLVAVIVSRAPVAQPVADLLITLRSPQGVQKRRVVLLMPPALHASVSPISLAAVAPTGDILVRRGDTASGIARRLQARPGYGDASIYQVLAAILRANPSAFIDGNLNRLRAGVRLSVPDAASVRAIDEAEARQLYARHMQGFSSYRGRVATAAAVVPATATTGQASGRVEVPTVPELPPTGRDELRLSAAQPGEVAGRQAQIDRLQDERAATERALAEARSRTGAVEANVNELKRLLDVQNAALARLQNANGTAPAAAGGTAHGVAAAGSAGAVGSAAAGSAVAAAGALAAGAAAGTGNAVGTAPGAAASGAAGSTTALPGAGASATSEPALQRSVPGQQGVPGQPPRSGADAASGSSAGALLGAGSLAAGNAAVGSPAGGSVTERPLVPSGTVADSNAPRAVQALGQGSSTAAPGWLERNTWLVAGLAILFIVIVLALVFRRRAQPAPAAAPVQSAAESSFPRLH